MCIYVGIYVCMYVCTVNTQRTNTIQFEVDFLFIVIQFEVNFSSKFLLFQAQHKHYLVSWAKSDPVVKELQHKSATSCDVGIRFQQLIFCLKIQFVAVQYNFMGY